MDKRLGSGVNGRAMLVRVPVELHRAVKRRAAEQDVTMDDVVVGILTAAFARQMGQTDKERRNHE